MSAEHTPGEWRTAATDDSLIVVGRTKIAQTYEVDGDVWGAANARLISAAPDMLAALRWIETYARVQVERHPEAEDTPGWACILAAIRKATTAIEPNSVGTPQGVNQK